MNHSPTIHCDECGARLTHCGPDWLCSNRACKRRIPKRAGILLPLALLVALAGCTQLGAVWATIGKVLDAVNTARRVGDTALCAAMPDAGSCVPPTSGGAATDAAGGER